MSSGVSRDDKTAAYGRAETLARVRRLFAGLVFFGALAIMVASVIAAARGLHGYADVFSFLMIMVGGCILMLSGLGMTK